LLLGHTSAVTSLQYFPAAMLLVSSDSKSQIRFWDPCATSHRLSHPAACPHLRLWPGHYQGRPEEWTATGSSC
ncbi:unnamed protein product, partial [Chrysoparadoxa australica]